MNDELVISGEKAFDLDKRVDESRKAIGENFLALGGVLKQIRDTDSAKLIMGDSYSTFDHYLATKRFSRSAAYAWVKIYETFIEKYNIPADRLVEAGWGALGLLLPVVNDKNYDNLLEKAEALSISDLKTEIREEIVSARKEEASNQLDNPIMSDMIKGKVEEELPKLPDASVDCVITVPPEDPSWLDEIKRILKPEGSVFLMVDIKTMFNYGFFLTGIEFNIIRDIVWSHKPIPTSSGLMRSHQTVIWASNGKRPTCNIIEPEKDIWEVQGQFPLDDPSDKPESLISKIIEMSTLPKETILDPFCGSGTVLIVGRNMGRNVIGIKSNKKQSDDISNKLK